MDLSLAPLDHPLFTPQSRLTAVTSPSAHALLSSGKATRARDRWGACSALLTSSHRAALDKMWLTICGSLHGDAAKLSMDDVHVHPCACCSAEALNILTRGQARVRRVELVWGQGLAGPKRRVSGKLLVSSLLSGGALAAAQQADLVDRFSSSPARSTL